MTHSFARRVFCTAVLSVVALNIYADSPSEKGHASTIEFQRDVSELDSLRKSGDLDLLERSINRDSAKWRPRGQDQFVRYMFQACSTLSSYDIGDISKRAMLLSNCAIPVLRSGNLTLEENVQFVEFFAMDPPEINEKKWKVLRKQKARLWLAAWRRIADSIDPTFNFDERVYVNVPAPSGSGVPAGSSPDAVKDPRLRAEYERASAENSAKIRRLNEQSYLKRTASRFFTEAETYLISAYSRSPKDIPELEQLLAAFVSDPAARKRISDGVGR